MGVAPSGEKKRDVKVLVRVPRETATPHIKRLMGWDRGINSRNPHRKHLQYFLACSKYLINDNCSQENKEKLKVLKARFTPIRSPLSMRPGRNVWPPGPERWPARNF